MPSQQFKSPGQVVIKPHINPSTGQPSAPKEVDEPPPAHLAEAIAFLNRKQQLKEAGTGTDTHDNTQSRDPLQTNVAGPVGSQSNNVVDATSKDRYAKSHMAYMDPKQPNNEALSNRDLTEATGVNINEVAKQEQVQQQYSNQAQREPNSQQQYSNQAQQGPISQQQYSNQAQQGLNSQQQYSNQAQQEPINQQFFQIPSNAAAQNALQKLNIIQPAIIHTSAPQNAFQDIQQPVPRHVLFPKQQIQPQQLFRRSGNAAPKYVVIRSPETGAFQLTEVSQLAAANIQQHRIIKETATPSIIRETVPPPKAQFQYPNIFDNAPKPAPAPPTYNPRPPPPPQETMAPTIRFTPTPTTTTTAPPPRRPAPTPPTTQQPTAPPPTQPTLPPPTQPPRTLPPRTRPPPTLPPPTQPTPPTPTPPIPTDPPTKPMPPRRRAAPPTKPAGTAQDGYVSYTEPPNTR